jgi:hypothetical protein
MNWRDVLFFAWAVERGGFTRLVALLAVLIIAGLAVVFFLALIGGPSEIVRHAQAPLR